MSKKLTHEFIAMRTKCDRLENIKNLNLWGNDLDDVSILKNMQNLEVVSLSVNKIRTLKDFSYLKNLKELYLRKNSISDIAEVKYLANLSNLRVLWLSENPVAETKNYRNIVIRSLPQITKLDDNVISIDEREKAEDTGYGGDYDNEEKSWDEGKLEVEDEEENVFESQKFGNNLNNYYERENIANANSHLNTNQTSQNEIYSNNERNKKIKDKFTNNQVNLNVNQNAYNKKFSVNYDDNSQLSQNFENLNIRDRENVQKNIKRTYTTNTPVATYETSNDVKNNYEYVNKKPQQRASSGYRDNSSNSRDFPSNYSNNNQPQQVKSNLYNCAVMLLKELNQTELEMLKSEIDKKLTNY